MKKWESEKQTNLEHASRRVSKAMLPLTVLFLLQLENGEHVAGRWCNWIMVESLGPLHGMYGSMEVNLRSSAQSRGRS